MAVGSSSCRSVTAVTGSSEAVEESLGENSPDSESHVTLRANTTTQVCWHRMATVGMADMQAMLKVARLTTMLFYYVILFIQISASVGSISFPGCAVSLRLSFLLNVEIGCTLIYLYTVYLVFHYRFP